MCAVTEGLSGSILDPQQQQQEIQLPISFTVEANSADDVSWFDNEV